ncbi:MAG: FtsX-like permease family protein [Gammaproteobacteria bacterium]|nr:MAG: FtsX-like permease family protein [Gammaproteobacteria bacterium]
MSLGFILRLAWRDWRGGELGLLVIALMVAVGTVTAVSLFVDRLHQAMLKESSSFLAADRYIGSSTEIPDEFRQAATELGLDTADTLSFPSMVFTAEDKNSLVSVKAVGPGYPLRGVLRVTDVPFTPPVVTTELPEPGEVWLDGRLFPSLGVEIGDQVEVGYATLTISKVLTSEPDRGGSMYDLGPRLLMRVEDVPATQVVQPGSRLSYRLLLRGDESVLDTLRDRLDLEEDPNFWWRSIKESSPTIGSALNRAESFLLLGGLLGVLLAGVAVALSAHRYARRHYDHVGVLKTLGATPNQILYSYVGLLVAVGGIAVTLGLLVGSGLHMGIVLLLQSLIPVALPMPSARPFLLGAVTGLICAIAFALPPLLHLKNISPMRVIRRDVGAAPPSQIASYGAAVAGSLGLLIWYSGSIELTAWTLLGTLGALALFGALATLLLRGGRVVGMQAGSGLRLALAGLQRRRKENTAQILIFGLAIMLLLILLLLRTALLDEWRDQVPENAPNHFALNIAPHDVEEIGTLLEANSREQGGLFPMIRGRITAVNGIDAKEWEAEHRSEMEDGPRLSSGRNLTWAADMPDDNTLVDGDWWSEDDTRSMVSLEDDYAYDLGLSIGDVLSFDIGGEALDVEVVNLRRLNWESMRPNFFIIFSPGALENFPATWMTSFYLEPENKQFLNELLSRFPTITVIEVDAIIAQVQSIIARVTQAVELVLALVLASGCLVLIASIHASRDARMSEHALIRTLGGTRKLIASSLTAEFAALGLFAGVVAVVGAEVTVLILQTQVFELEASVHPWLWMTGPLIGAMLILLVGILGTRQLIAAPPITVLRGLN